MTSVCSLDKYWALTWPGARLVLLGSLAFPHASQWQQLGQRGGRFQLESHKEDWSGEGQAPECWVVPGTLANWCLGQVLNSPPQNQWELQETQYPTFINPHCPVDKLPLSAPTREPKCQFKEFASCALIQKEMKGIWMGIRQNSKFQLSMPKYRLPGERGLNLGKYI